MSLSMTPPRSEIRPYITRGKSDRWMARETHHGRDLIREVRRGLNSPSDLFSLKHSLGSRRKVNNDIISEIAQLTRRNPGLRCTRLTDILCASDDFPTVHKSRCAPPGADSAFRITSEKLSYRSSLNFARSELGPLLYLIRISDQSRVVLESRALAGDFTRALAHLAPFQLVTSQMTDYPLLGVHCPTATHISGFPAREVAGRHETF
jgi:hypothetical protein